MLLWDLDTWSQVVHLHGHALDQGALDKGALEQGALDQCALDQGARQLAQSSETHPELRAGSNRGSELFTVRVPAPRPGSVTLPITLRVHL